jgi:O-antigen/teichoic acid export membrane protein
MPTLVVRHENNCAMTRLGRIADYQAPWVGRTGLALIVALWLLVTLVGFAVGVATGIGILIVGGALIGGEVWIARKGKTHPRFALVWRLAWRVGMGIFVISVGVPHHGWGAVFPALLGSWLILTGLGQAWLDRRAVNAERGRTET